MWLNAAAPPPAKKKNKHQELILVGFSFLAVALLYGAFCRVLQESNKSSTNRWKFDITI